MPAHHQEHHSPYSTRQLFNMVADVEKYPEFIPWVAAARILSRNGNELKAELVVRFKTFTDRYTSRVLLNPPEGKNGECSIDVSLVSGPFHHLDNNWKFRPDGDESHIIFDIDFSFKSKMLQFMIGSVFDKATMRLLEAFENRADELYG